MPPRAEMPAPRRAGNLQLKADGPLPSVESLDGAPGARSPSASDRAYGPIQMKAGDTSSETVRNAAEQGVAGGGGALPHHDAIQTAFGKHDVSGISAHTGAQATQANNTIGSQAYAVGDQVAFKGTPDLHTAAHEAAHVVQQRGGVHLKDGVGETGDQYERHADQVADATVAGKSAESLLDPYAGASGGGRGVQSKAVQLLGTALDKELPVDAALPAHGEEKGKQRKYSPEQYIEMWEKEQGRKVTPQERETIARGCIGITANNLVGGGNPLNYAEKTFGNFDQAHKAMIEGNKTLDSMATMPGGAMGGEARYVVFAKLFWSNQSEVWEDRLKPDDKAFQPDEKTGEVDMTGYKYKAQSRIKKDPKTGQDQKYGYVNFDYGFWDEASQCFWHANHMQYKDAKKAAEDPMIVLQSTRDKFVKGYFDFDRIVFCIAKAENYAPGLAAIVHAGGGGT
ncbi:MAG: DUF4157 domain-containing protein [Myxococcales bacterium]|nr:DUF4157 domain-containing protein [Myxococcales bacterium]